MLLFLFLFALALAAVCPSDEQTAQLQRGHCDAFWFRFNGRCYKYVSTPMTWADAELHCVSVGTNLVSIHSLEEQNFVKSLIKSVDQAHGSAWIGLSDAHKEGQWMWSDGSAVGFVLWFEGEPNNAEGKEHCAHEHSNTEMKWNDIDCSTTRAFVCASRKICP
ncbi:ladderlectin-like [Cheilinus undulatus]|uniref:ladderlectin-like n=1 Tax=Cheilinus undulatus TaxID=241271 RepID=UPI001BD3F9E8|nr:ladderlectin-like [Cheilinus undulatus]